MSCAITYLPHMFNVMSCRLDEAVHNSLTEAVLVKTLRQNDIHIDMVKMSQNIKQVSRYLMLIPAAAYNHHITLSIESGILAA